MKPNQTKKKLVISKKTIASLTASEKMNIVGGVQVPAITTSFINCTGFLCCEQKTVPDPPIK